MSWRLKQALFAFCVLLLMLGMHAQAALLTIPELKTRVTDLTQTLNAEQQAQLEAKLASLSAAAPAPAAATTDVGVTTTTNLSAMTGGASVPKPTVPAATEAKPAPAKPAPAKPAPAKPTPPKAGTTASGQGKASATRAPLLGDDFLKDLRSKATSNAAKPGASGTPAATIGPAQVSALNAEIRRQLRPFWKAPSGADAELLRTVVSVNLARDGSLVGAPEVVDTTGITPSNQGQVKLHREQAIKAIRLAAPFKLPPDLYAGWKSLRISFDKRLSQ